MNGNDRSFVRAIRGPVTLITIGVLFALNNFTQYRFEQTWPVILIVFGLLSLLRRSTQPATPLPGSPAYSWPPPPGAYSSAGYRGSTYTTVAPSATPAPVKGGFGSTAPAKPNEPETPPSSGGEA